MAALFGLLTHAMAEKPLELRGELVIRFHNCGHPEHAKTKPDIEYLLFDRQTQKYSTLDLDAEQVKNLKVDTPVLLRGNFQENAPDGHSPHPVFKPTTITYEAGQAETGVTEPVVEGSVDDDLVAEGATTQNLRTLIIHANTADKTANASKVTAMENMVFNDANNMSNAVYAATYGHFRLTSGPLKSVIVNLPTTTASTTNYGTLAAAMISALPSAFSAQGQTFRSSDYARYIFCLPEGTLDCDTAIGQVGGYPAKTYFSYRWTGTTFDGILHELGHNFGFGHSGSGDEGYGDESCAMGYSHLGKGNVTASYCAHLKDQKGWFGPFPNTKATLTQDATYDLYPSAQDPEAAPGMRMISYGIIYRASYVRQYNPYAWLANNSDRDKVYVHVPSGGSTTNWRYAQLSPGGSYTASSTKVTFERYGPNNEYATVSFDMNDGNTKPVANAQSVSVVANTPKAITLSGSDADGNTLTYSLVTNPTNGSLSGTPPNLTYTSNNNYAGADSFVFKVHDGRISSFATISITVNSAPVANNQSVNAFFQTPQPITLTATDASNDPLTYSIVSSPSRGSLSGTLPNLTYTPNNGVSGSDSFTFRVYDGSLYSNTATVSINISSTPNTPPTTRAGADQTVSLQGGAGPVQMILAPTDPIQGIKNTVVGGNSTNAVVVTDWPSADESPPKAIDGSTGTKYLNYRRVNCGFHITPGAGATTLTGVRVYTANDADGRDPLTISIEGSNGGDLSLGSSWTLIQDNINLGIDASPGRNAAGPLVPLSASTAYTSYRILVKSTRDSGANSVQYSELQLHGYTGAATTVNLTGSVTDAEQTPTASWSVFSKNPSTAPNPTFGNASQPVTTASFREVGTYVLRLTGADGYTTSTDDVTISVVNGVSNALTVTNGSGDGTYAAGAQVQITADPPASGYRFVNWTSSGGGSFANPNSSTTTYTMPANAATVTANYALNTAPVVLAGSDQTATLEGGSGPVQMILAPTDPIQGIKNTVVGGNSTNGAVVTDWPKAEEGPPKAIDGSVTTKYLNYRKVGSGFYITPGVGATTLTGVRIYTANDFEGRDPLTISIEGSNGGDLSLGSSWTLIQDNINLGIDANPGRQQAGPLVTLAASAPYTSYRILVKSMRNSAENSVQYSELQLHGTTGAAPAASVNLTGSATDANNDPLTTTWSVFSKNPATAANPTFTNASQLSTTATFTEAGTYVLRLSAGDGFITRTDDVTITVNPPLPVKYASWSGGSFANAFTDTALTSNPDGDSMNNLMEFAFGTDPTAQTGGTLAIDGSANGSPTLTKNAGTIEFYFVRRKDHGTSGSVSYTPQFSSNLSDFTDSPATPTFVANSSVNANYEVVKVPFPNGTKFGRVQLTIVP